MGWRLYSKGKYLGVGCVIIPAYLAWIGYFRKMNIRKTKFMATELFYKSYQGPYDKKLGDEFHKIHDEVEKHKIANGAFDSEGGKYFGIYYDDPDEYKDHSKLRADIGFLLTTKTLKEEDKNSLLEEFGAKGFSYTQLEETNCLHDTFPIKWPKFVSFILGPKKYYSELKRLIKNDSSLMNDAKEAPGYAAFETYRPDKIGFYFPLEKVDQYYLTKLDPPGNKKN